MNSQLTGLIAATHTPMHADGSLNLAVIERYAELLSRQGVTGAFICGTTGEGASLTLAERFEQAERWRAVAGPNLQVIVCVSHTCLADCKTLAAHARKIGANAIAANGLNYFRPARLEELVRFCAEIAAAAPNLPFYYYHIPDLTGIPFAMAAFLMEASSRISNLAGLKFSSRNLVDFGQCLALKGGRFNLLFGCDELYLSALTLGARSAVGSTYNFAASLYQPILKAFQTGDLKTARKEQVRATQLVAALKKHGGLIAAGKVVMQRIGLDCGPVRLPLRSLTESEKFSLETDLREIGTDSFSYKLN